ncbi:NAD(P)/FAD-dependent oxidoreductase [Pseudaestuariivita rosea]|uniref:NAD(P)/FAD-dependent oxidoreductase n=1 Tax=Pseudaestuariivita rosea TaxID=2763263 RepID=UPI001ABB77E7|nr:FAD-binding oxidoreductase [Pseudaestuariivita rosea]
MVDVTVCGAGIFGLSVAYACLRRGAQVQIVDPNGVGAGASGGIVGALAPHTPENWNPKKDFQFDSLIMAEDYWAGVERLSALPTGYARLGRLQPIADDHTLTLARDRATSAKRLWQGQADWRVVPASDHAGWAPQSPTGWLIHDTLSARIHPRQATTALAQAIAALGGHITHRATLAGQIVWATGYDGLLELSRDLGTPVGNGVKGQAALLGFEARKQPQLFADALHIVPHHDGTVAIGSTSERDFDDPTSIDTQLDDVIARAMDSFPMLADAPVIERWAGIRPRAKSRAPMLGGYPGKPDQFIANGGFKIGFGMAPKVGEVMADLILDARDTIPEGFRVEDNF